MRELNKNFQEEVKALISVNEMSKALKYLFFKLD